MAPRHSLIGLLDLGKVLLCEDALYFLIVPQFLVPLDVSRDLISCSLLARINNLSIKLIQMQYDIFGFNKCLTLVLWLINKFNILGEQGEQLR